MAKNMTRKGLAIAAAGSLAVLGIAVPAQAAGIADSTKVSLAPASGTGYNVLAGNLQTFKLKANEAANIVGGDVSFMVADADAAVFPLLGDANTTGLDGNALALTATDGTWGRDADSVVTVDLDPEATGEEFVVGEMIYVAAGALVVGGGDGSADVPEGYYTVTAVSADDDTISFNDGVDAEVAATDGDFVTDADGIISTEIVRDADDNSFVVDSDSALSTSTENLTLVVMSDASAAAQVYAWVDDNNDGAVDTTEYTSLTQTVGFLGADDLTPSVEWDATYLAASVSADVTFAESINWTQSADITATLRNVLGEFAGDATVTETDGVTTVTDGATEVGAGDVNSKVEAGWVTLVISTPDGSEIATFRTKIVDLDVTYLIPSVTDSADIQAAASDADGTAVAVRAETESVTITVEVVDSNGDPISGANVVVSEAGTTSIAADADVSVGSEDVNTTTDTFDSFTLVTDANGEVSVVVTSANGKATDVVEVKFTADGVAIQNDSNHESSVELTWTAVDYSASVVNVIDAADNASANADGDGLRADSFAADIKVEDQWGVSPLNGTYRIETTVGQDGESDNSFTAVVDGMATVGVESLADTDGGLITATFDLQAYSSSTATFADEDAAFATLYLQPIADEQTADVTATSADASQAVNTQALAAANTKLGDSAPDVEAASKVTITGTVVDELTGAIIKGSPVTISGDSNLLFVADGVYSFGSITGWAGDDGAFSFDVYSNISGDYTVSVASLGGTDEVDITIEAALARSGADVSIAITNAKPGQTMKVVTTIVDAFGNAVDTNQDVDAELSITYDGPGFIVGGDTPTETTAAGTATFYVFLGNNDIVDGSVIAVYGGEDGAIESDGNAANGDETEDNLAASASLSVAAAAAATRGWTKNLGDGTVKMYAKNIIGAGKVQFYVNGDEVAWVRAVDATDPKLSSANGFYYIVRTVELVEGQKNALEIYIDGVRVWRAAYAG